MTSIFDQYEQATQPFGKCVSGIDTSCNFLNGDVGSNEGGPSLKISKLDSMPVVTSKLQFMASVEDNIVFVTVNNLLYHFNKKNSEKVKEIDINKSLGYACKIKNLFVDPICGNHILLSAIPLANSNSSPASANAACDLIYLGPSASGFKLKLVTRMRSFEVTAVGWNRWNATYQYIPPLLLGTSKGLIFEMELNFEPDKLFQSSAETYCRQVFDIGKNSSVAIITGLELHRFSNASDMCFIMVTTTIRMYQFIGRVNHNDEKPMFLQLFNNYLKDPEGFIEVPNKNSWSPLQIYYAKKKSTGKNAVYPKSFGWLIEDVGIVYGEFLLEYQEGMKNVTVRNHRLEYNPMRPPAIGFVLTNFHALLLYPDKIVGISVLNTEVAFICNYDESYGRYLSICRDDSGNITLLSERTIYKVNFQHEDKFIWKTYLEMNEFSLAKEYCASNLSNLHTVLKQEAAYYFDRRLFERSALLYAEIDGISFEEIALKFLQAWQIEALKLFLLKTLEKLKVQESTHITMITFWLIEINENQLTDARFNDRAVDELLKYQQNFEQLLTLPNVYNCVKTNKEIAYKIMDSHGDSKNLIYLANLFKDYEKIIRHYLEDGDIGQALKVLKQEPSSSMQKTLINTFMPEFLSLAPKETVELLKKFGRQIEPLLVLPYLIFPCNLENDFEASEVIGYLEYCIHSLHAHDEAIHNYLITLYAKYKPEKIIQYLATQGQDPSMVTYDIRYALKLCQEIGLMEACVQLSAMLGLWESAVDLALSVSTDLAKQTVQTVSQPSTHNPELCKKLWLKIAKHVVNEHNDIEQAMEFLQQCDLVKIEDILPFFNDFVTIDHFKDAVCTSLQEYNQNIELLKEEMEDATKSADVIRNDIQSFKNRYSVIQSSDLCSSCNIQLLLRPFYIFPCSHYFHTDCLIRELKLYLNDVDINKIETLQHQIWEASPNNSSDDGVSVSSNSMNVRDQLKMEFDSLIAAECCFCGSLSIEQIDRPFIEDDDFERIRLDWE